MNINVNDILIETKLNNWFTPITPIQNEIFNSDSSKAT